MRVRFSAVCRSQEYDGVEAFSLECELDGDRIRAGGPFPGSVYIDGELWTFDFDRDGDLYFPEDQASWSSNLRERTIAVGEYFTLWDEGEVEWTYQIETVAQLQEP